MVRRAALAAYALVAGAPGCIHPDYHCMSDLDCDVGEAGRCELDQRCTTWDPTCATHRRYSDHSGPRSGACFDDQIAPLDPCAAGQPPAIATPGTPGTPGANDACAATVCQALPGCCATGWSEACVQQAQILCSDLVCDTRIAITANKPGRTDLWDLQWDGVQWHARLDPRQTVLAWLAPASGQRQPRLAAFASGALTYGDGTSPAPISIPVSTAHNYLEATSVDFDRDGRDTIALGFTDATGPHLEIVKLDLETSRVVNSAGVTRLSWGDVDHDAFPDGIAEAGGGVRYHLLSNTESDDRSRQIDDRVSTTVNGGTSSTVANNPPAIRSFDWIDIDRDHQIDVVAYGYAVDVHSGKPDAIGTTALIRIDCAPPGPAAGCDTTVQADQAFAGAAIAAPSGSALVIATHPGRALYRAELRGTPANTALTPYVFPTEACGAACPPIIAVVVRDLDGDHRLDVVAIDGNLQVYTSLATDNLVLHPAIKLPTTPIQPGFFVVRTSVSGALR
ncbi:MAG: hypothetical protein E6J90_07945 [Deltaproteobacteria bacterium]|nr:MAG: hypothetical protein E6J91_24055 [Deltaproteobacteria bacterium]TMQ24462.1 MAG: hypothetical protein E6J90_07945 [Deltaproteobacteria bacterium]